MKRVGLTHTNPLSATGLGPAVDVLAAWLEECCIVKHTAEAKASDLYASYTGWCEANGERPELQRSFGSRLTERGFERKRRMAGHCWLGIGLLTVAPNVGNDPYDPIVDIATPPTSSRESIRKTGSYGSYGTYNPAANSTNDPPEPDADGAARTAGTGLTTGGGVSTAGHWLFVLRDGSRFILRATGPLSQSDAEDFGRKRYGEAFMRAEPQEVWP